MAALNDSDIQIAAHAAKILATIKDDPRTIAAVIENFASRIENGGDLHNSPFYDAMLELHLPEAEKLIQKVRPSPAGALHVFRKTYPGVQVSNMSLPPGKQHPTAEPFRLKYLNNGKAKEMKLVFRLNEDGNWLPDPPLPDALP
ncbi:hypothetical protein EGM51_00815 [Verrucomicrobia bacterium S94]|nr:hypothetical protein EGM51_00815 [Verrucomicrobia bacterium S94]